jgi:RNA polymerase sigma factor (sigma-70 family)
LANEPLGTVFRQLRGVVAFERTKNQSDGELLCSFRQRQDQDAFAALLRRHGRLVWHICRRVLHNEHDAEDAFQATFLVLARKAGSIRQAESVSSWLHGVAHRIAMETKRKAARRRAHERQVPCHSPQPAISETAWQDLQEALDEELRQLPEKYRAPFILCCLENKSLADAAKQLGWKVGTVSGRLSRARQILQDRLSKRGVMLSAVLTGLAVGPSAATAAVPAVVANATTDAALAFATGSIATAGIISANVLALTKADLKGMLFTKVKIVTALVLTMTLAATAVGIAAHQVLRPGDQTQKSARPAEEPTAGVEKKPREPRVDLYGDPLPEGAVARLGTTRFRHEPRGDGWLVTAISRDGKILATHDTHESLRLWSLEDGKLLREIRTNARTYPIAFTPDGKRILTCTSNTTDFYEVATGRKVRSIPYPSWNAAISPDCRLIACPLEGGDVQVMDLESGKERQRLRGAWGMEFASDGKGLISASAKARTIRRLDLATGKLSTVTLDLPEPRVEVQQTPRERLSFDGKSLAVFQGIGPVKICDTETGKVKLVLQGEQAGGYGQPAFSPDDRVLLTFYWASHTPIVSFWDTRTGKLIRRFDDPGRSVSPWTTSVEFSPDGKMVLEHCSYPVLCLWDPLTGRRIHNLNGHEGTLRSLAFSSDGKQLVSSASDRTIRVWDIPSSRQLGMIDGGLYRVNNKTIVTGDQDGAHVRELPTGKETRRFPFDKWNKNQKAAYGFVSWIAVSPDGKTAVVYGSAGVETVQPGVYRSMRKVYGWDLTSGRLLFKRDNNDPQSPYISADTRVLARLLTSPLPQKYGGLGPVTAQLLLEETSTGRQLLSIQLPDYYGERFTYSSDGQMMATTSYQTKEGLFHDPAIHIWETVSGQECLRIALPQMPGGGWQELVDNAYRNTPMAFSPNERFLIVCLDDQLRIFDLASGREQEGLRVALRGKPDRTFGTTIGAKAFSPDGRFLALGHRDCTLSILDLANGKETGRYPGHQSDTHCLSFSPDNKFLASGYSDTTILLWDVSSATANPSPAVKPARVDIETLWAALSGQDAPKAHRAIWGLAAAPELAIPWLRERLKATTAIPADDLNQAIAELETTSFAKREAASKKLTEWEELAEPALEGALKTKLSAEQRRRIEAIFNAPRPVPKSEKLRQLRSVQVLEHIATSTPGADKTRLAAIDLLKQLAAGVPEARLTQEAKASLERLERQADMRH